MDDAGLRVLQAVEAVDRREEEVADALAEVLRRIDLLERPWLRDAVLVVHIGARGDQERREPDEERDDDEHRHRARELEALLLLGSGSAGACSASLMRIPSLGWRAPRRTASRQAPPSPTRRRAAARPARGCWRSCRCSEHEHRRVRHPLAHRLDEGDRAAGCDLDGLRAPGRAHRRHHGVPRRAARARTKAVADRAGRHLERHAERALRLEMPDHGGLRLGGGLFRVNTHVEHRTGGRLDGGRSALDGGAVDPEHRDAGAAPDLRADPAAADDRHVVLDLGEPPELVLGVGLARPLLAAKPLHRDIAVPVPERRQRTEEHDERVGGSATVLARVLVARKRPHLDGDAGVAAQRDGQRRLPRADRATVGDEDRVRAERLGVRGRVPLLERAPNLLLSLDQELDPDRRPALPRAQRADVDEDVRLRVGRRHVRRSPRRARSPRTAGRSTTLRPRPARRRSARRAARSEHPAEREISPVITGAVPSSSSELKLSTPASRRRASTAWCASRSAGLVCAGKPHSDTEGIATSRARSAFSRGISAEIVAWDERALIDCLRFAVARRRMIRRSRSIIHHGVGPAQTTTSTSRVVALGRNASRFVPRRGQSCVSVGTLGSSTRRAVTMWSGLTQIPSTVSIHDVLARCAHRSISVWAALATVWTWRRSPVVSRSSMNVGTVSELTGARAQGPVREVATVDGTRHAARGTDAGSLDMRAYRGDRGRRIAPRDACETPWFTFRTGP